MVPFEFDQEYAANFAYSVLKVYPIQLIGQGLSVQGLFMGPLYFYYLTPFYALSGLHPLGGAVGSVVLGLITVSAYFFIIRKIFGTVAGLIAASFRALLISQIQGDWGTVPAFSSDLLVLATWYCFYKYWHGEKKYLVGVGFIFGLYTSIHPILFPLYFVFILLLVIKKSLPKIKTALLGLTAFFIPLLPLIIFEYLHNFLEVKMLFQVSTGSGMVEPINIERFITHLKSVVYEPYRALGTSFIPKDIFIGSVILVSLLLIIKRIGFWKDIFHPVLLLATYGVFLLYYTLLPAHVPEYYFTAPTVLTLIYLAASLSLLTKKTYTKIFLVCFLGIVFYSNMHLLQLRWNNPSPSALANKDAIVQQIVQKQSKNGEFYVSYIKVPGWNFGFDYLFKYYGYIPQTREAKPPIYTIVIPRSLVSDKDMDFTSGNIGLILPK